MFTMVVLTPEGEMSHGKALVGDRVGFRVDTGNLAQGGPQDLSVLERVPHGLSEVSVGQGGVWDERTRTATWTVHARRRGGSRTLDLWARVTTSGQITHRATVIRHGLRPVTSEPAVLDVADPPDSGWVRLTPDTEEDRPGQTYLKDETTTGITVRFDLAGLFVQERRHGDVLFHCIGLPGRADTTQVGAPQLPLLGELLEIPPGVHVTAEVVESDVVELQGYHVWPAQEPLPEQVPGAPAFALDPLVYAASVPWPASPVTVDAGELLTLRGHRLLALHVAPVQYEPVSRTLTVHRMIEVRLRYDRPAQVRALPTRLRSAAVEDLLAACVLNYRPQERFMTEAPHGDHPAGCDYLILSHDAFYDAADPTNPVLRLADWKRRKGYRTRVVPVGSLPGGNTAESVTAFVKDAYLHWDPPPTYLLLVGDSDLVHPVVGVRHPEEHDPVTPQPQVQTDLLHVTLAGADLLPDVYVGRLSADSLAQVTDIVDKIIAYEQTPPSSATYADFYADASLVGLYTEDHAVPASGQESRPWIANLENIRTFLQGLGYTVDRHYATDTGFPANPAVAAPQQFCDGTAMPNDLLWPQYGWDADAADVRAALDAGRFFVAYRGHGNPDSWDNPGFDVGDVASLAQNDRTPLVLSITCQAGWYDNETDDDAHGGRGPGDEALAEALLRRPHAGAVGLLAMTRISYTGHNDALVFGAIKALWPSFEPTPHWSLWPTVTAGRQITLRHLGQIAAFALLYMAQAYAASDRSRLEAQMLHLHGDPELAVWTAAPGDLAVAHPEGIGVAGRQDFVVSVHDAATGDAVVGATVALTRDHALVAVERTRTGGHVTFDLTSVGPGDLELTVTAAEHRPYLGAVAVTPLGAELNRLDPVEGPEGEVVNVGGRHFAAGEAVSVRLDGTVVLRTAAQPDGSFGQTAPSVDLVVPAGTPHGWVTIEAVGATSGRHAVRTFHVRDRNAVDLWTYDQANPTTWSLHPGDNPTWDSPDVQLYDENHDPVSSGNLLIGHEYTVEATVRNASPYPAANARVEFTWSDFGAGGHWETLPPIVSVDVPGDPPGLVTATTTFRPALVGHQCVQVRIDHVEDVDFTNDEGQENLQVGMSSSPARHSFVVANPTERPAPVHVEVRQLFDPTDQQRRPWATEVEHPRPQVLLPGERARVTVLVDPEPADAPMGATADFAVTCFVGGKMIGGVNLRITRGD